MSAFRARKPGRHRLLLAIVAAAVMATTSPGIVSANSDVQGAPRNRVVKAVNDFDVRINRALQVQFFFNPGRSRVATGGTLTFRNFNRSPFPDEAALDFHTLTIVNEDELPSDVEEVFSCFDTGPCSLAAGHFDQNGDPIPGHEVLNEGRPGLDTRGDSLLIGVPSSGIPEVISAKVSAPAGTNLFFLCAIHAWMQGELRVKRG
jgi:hypothetical protein